MIWPATRSARVAVVLGCLLASGASPALASILSEAVVGDFSGNRLKPTAWVLEGGVNSLIATTSAVDLDYVTFRIPVGWRMSEMILTSYASTDGRAFMGMMAGEKFTVTPTSPVISDMIGYTHFGPESENIGLNVLPAMAVAEGTAGFLIPLSAGDYSLWLQQHGATTSYQFDLVLITSPPLVGDADGDGTVGAGDYVIWAATFGQTGEGLAADFDANGAIGSGDYALWAANFGKTLPQGGGNVPEPATLWLGLVGGLAVLGIYRWRR